MVVFMLLVAEYFYRYSVDRPIRRDEAYLAVSQRYGSEKPTLSRKLKFVCVGLSFATIFLFIRFVQHSRYLRDMLTKSHMSPVLYIASSSWQVDGMVQLFLRSGISVSFFYLGNYPRRSLLQLQTSSMVE